MTGVQTCALPISKNEALRLASELRQGGVTSILSPSRGLRSQLRYANAKNCTHAVIIGDDELAKGVAMVRDLRQSEQSEVSLDSVVSSFTENS